MELIVFILIGVIFLIAVIIGTIKGKSIYEQIAQLKYQNRLLKALRNLDIVALSSTEITLLCQQIVNLIQGELGYFFGAIALVDPKAGGLRRIAISENPNISETLKNLNIEYQSQKPVPFDQKDNLLIKVLESGKTDYTSKLFDIQIGVQPEDISQKLQDLLGMKGFFVYPLISKNRVIGVVYYCTLVRPEKLSHFEYEVMDEFSREVMRVLENVLLYQDLRQASVELRQLNQKLEQLDKLKDDFVSIASHELRTPMTAIRSFVWMALHRSDIPLSQKLQKYLYRTLISTERLINLVNDMLNVSRIEAGRIEINPRPIDLISLVKDIIEDVKPKAEEKRLQVLMLEHPIPKVFADPEKIEQIVLNLIGNALKFTYPGGLVTISFFTDGKMVELSVKDNGSGIAPDDLGRLFRKFARLDNSFIAISTSGGTGLGLYISRNLIELMHGKIWVTSEGVGKGATFSFSLPVATAELVNDAAKYHVKPMTGEAKPLEPVTI